MKKIICAASIAISGACFAQVSQESMLFEKSNDDAVLASAIWLEDHDASILLSEGMSIDMAYDYFVRPTSGGSKLFLRLCENMAPCELFSLDATLGVHPIHYGLDSTQYHMGKNYYSLTLLMLDDAGEVSESTINIDLTVIP